MIKKRLTVELSRTSEIIHNEQCPSLPDGVRLTTKQTTLTLLSDLRLIPIPSSTSFSSPNHCPNPGPLRKATYLKWQIRMP